MKAIRKRNVSLAMVVVMALTMLAGCGMKPDDAKAYVQATLDAGYKADFDEYAKITDSTKEDSGRSVQLRRQLKSIANCSRRSLQRPNIQLAT